MEREFTEREGFEGFGDLGDLPEDLRGLGPVSFPDGTGLIEGDMFSLSGGAQRANFETLPQRVGGEIEFRAINYLPRANYESFRSQRFFASGNALLPSVGSSGSFTDLFVDTTTLPPGSPQTASSGILQVPIGYGAVITGLRQWVGDATAVQKSDGTSDDITWKIEVASAPVFSFGNFPCVISALDNEAKLFVIVVEESIIQLSAKNTISSTDPLARDIPVKGALTGHWFPIDELDDIFRNR